MLHSIGKKNGKLVAQKIETKISEAKEASLEVDTTNREAFIVGYLTKALEFMIIELQQGYLYVSDKS